MTEQQIQEVNQLDLVEQFANFQFPVNIEKMLKSGTNPFGSSKLIKLYYFAAKVNLQNEDYDRIIAIKPARQENETYEYYKQRQKLQKFLGKMKPFFYDYSIYDLDKQKRKIQNRKNKKLS